jgi:hypothetical protein
MTNQELGKWFDAVGQAKGELKAEGDLEGEAFMLDWLKCPTPKKISFSLLMKCVMYSPSLKKYVFSWNGSAHQVDSTEEIVPLVETLGYVVTGR